ncbi:FAD-dependent monooxygenase [Acidicapsa dinghuensis]|uniref:FAD-dependent monooxygenase n=1 Tax=Acidicapsa dinghuensis TaxID=2218256 RepID=A0ABW1EJQ3_9BACT|nr:FAD-dependent monooxygenase [Acidicapsa dinghuensis]
MTKHEVVIAGAGPTGLMLAGELALAGVDVAIVERRESEGLAGLRAGGLHIRTIEVFDQRGIAERFLWEGHKALRAPFAHTPLDISDLPTRHSYFLALWQMHIERILAGWVGELGITVHRGASVTAFRQDEDGVDVELADAGLPDGRQLRAQYLVGCDGGRSIVRKTASIEFPGWDATASYLISEVETADEPEWGLRRGTHGISAIAKLDDGRARVVLHEERIMQGIEPTIDDVRNSLTGVYGTDFGLRSASQISRFTDMTRQAAQYRVGRVLLAGDAAHVHSPMGGQGLNLGVQDAVNLGWKLALVVQGKAPESLLDTYHAERHPVGARVLRNTMALTAMERSEDRIDALRAMMAELMQQDETRRRYFAMMSGLDVHYDMSNGDTSESHPLPGRRMPDLDVTIDGATLRVFSLLHEARAVLLNLSEPGTWDVSAWADRVKLVNAAYAGEWDLPVIGVVTAPKAVLIRPDGYVAWVADATAQGLDDAMSRWFGPPAAA